VSAESTTLGKNTFVEQNKMAANKNDEFPPLGSDKCGICTKKVLAKDKALQCEICFVWYHCDCEGIDDKKQSMQPISIALSCGTIYGFRSSAGSGSASHEFFAVLAILFG
jgi:hypothetical protein